MIVVTDSQATLTVDQLAQRVGMTVRNVRAHQSRGLLPPPVVRGRTGYYGAEHESRLQLIKEMQAQGFNLRAIQHQLDHLPPGGAAEVLAFRRELTAPWQVEEPEVFTVAELGDLMGVVAEGDAIGVVDQSLLDQAVSMGALHPLGGDRYEAPSPTLIRAGAQLVELGVPLPQVLLIQKSLTKHAEGVAATYVDMFVEHVWRHFVDAGQPEEEWPAVRGALERMAPLASQALLASFRLAMQDASARAIEQEAVRESRRSRKRA